MKKFGTAISLIGLVLIAVALATMAFGERSESANNARPPFALTDASPSAPALIQRLLAALERKDEATLHSLRMSEREYREIIAPGTVPPGQPPRHTDDKVSQFYWRMLDSKSRDLGRELLYRFGGRKLDVGEVEYVKGPLEYAWYQALGQARIHVKNEKGDEAIIPAGYVAEVDGQFKFIGLNWND